ncbi:MAG: hypothetical protein M0006_08680 [Magnetospirillum sp.]|nr:hypothetical protein [Magnetospirillum sp.]
MRIGIDLDNTLIGYDRLFLRIARDWNLVPADFSGGKTGVRDAVRETSGESAWMRLQAEAYGVRMAEAELIEGADAFLRGSRKAGATVFVVSHKTKHAAADPGGIDLHRAALAWMEAAGFFSANGFALDRANIFFEPSREAKCRRIAVLDCRVFIDDLEEVFREPAFPPGVERLLLHRGEGAPPQGPFTVYRHWREVGDAVFAAP